MIMRGIIQGARKWRLPLMLVVAFSLLVWLLLVFRPPTPEQTQTAEHPVVAVMSVKKSIHHPTLVLYATVDTRQKTDLRAAVAADVKRVDVEEGDTVSPGQLLAALDDRRLRLQVQRAEQRMQQAATQISLEQTQHKADQDSLTLINQQLSLAHNNLKRQQALLRKGHGAQQSVDQAWGQVHEYKAQQLQLDLKLKTYHLRLDHLKLEKRQAELALQQAVLDLDHTKIQSPSHAVVLIQHIHVGDRVHPGTPLFALFDPDHLIMRAQLPQHSYAQIRHTLRHQGPLLAQAGDAQHIAHLSLQKLHRWVEAGQANIVGTFHFVDGQDNYHLNQTAQLSLQLPAVPASIVVPADALFQQHYVYRVRNKQIKAVRVHIAGDLASQGTHLRLITSPDLQSNDQVVIKALPGLVSGMQVHPYVDNSHEPRTEQ